MGFIQRVGFCNISLVILVIERVITKISTGKKMLLVYLAALYKEMPRNRPSVRMKFLFRNNLWRVDSRFISKQ